MTGKTLSRRDVIRLGVLASLAGLTSCTFDFKKPLITTSKGVLPKELLKSLPSSWQLDFVDPTLQTYPLNLYRTRKNTDLIILGDGWLKHLLFQDFQPIEEDELLNNLNRKSILFLSEFSPENATKILPIAFTPWVMLFRNGDSWMAKARKSWDVLLDPELAGKVVLPKSPRLILSISDRLGGQKALERLRLQSIAFDDQNGLNWVLSGKAKVAVLPLQHCLSLLSRDPRLNIAFPEEGSPLNWTIILRPKLTKEPLPKSWIQEMWEMPLLSKLLYRGWIPPLPLTTLIEGGKYLPDEFKEILFSSPEALQNSWSLSPLNNLQEKKLLERWIG